VLRHGNSVHRLLPREEHFFAQPDNRTNQKSDLDLGATPLAIRSPRPLSLPHTELRLPGISCSRRQLCAACGHEHGVSTTFRYSHPSTRARADDNPRTATRLRHCSVFRKYWSSCSLGIRTWSHDTPSLLNMSALTAQPPPLKPASAPSLRTTL
jgi:hypothetical protein